MNQQPDLLAAPILLLALALALAGVVVFIVLMRRRRRPPPGFEVRPAIPVDREKEEQA